MSNSKYLQQTRSLKLSPRRSGFSLIEVVIALGVFVFGALAIVRIFPGALGVIQNSEQRATAQRMAQTTLARYTNSPLSVPEAVIDVHPHADIYNATGNETGWSDFPGAVFGSGTRNDSLPRQPFDIDDISPDNSQIVSTAVSSSAAGRFRRVVGEEHTIQSETINGTPRGVLTLRYSYVASPAGNPVDGIRFFETFTANGITVDNVGDLNWTDATSSIDGASLSDTDTDAKRPSDAGMYNLRAISPAGSPQYVTCYVSYRYIDAAGTMRGVTDEPKRFPQDGSGSFTANSLKVLAAASGSAASVVPGPVQVKIRRNITPGVPAASSPNVLPSAAQTTATDRGLGRIVFDDTSRVGQRVSVDYTVPDWRMIVHDDNLSTKLSTDDQQFLTDMTSAPATPGTGRQTVVPTRFIADEQVSAVAPATRTSQVYALVKGTTSANVPVSSIAEWNPDSDADASRFGTPNDVFRPNANLGYKALGVRPKTGQVFFDLTDPTNTTESLRAASGRVVYRNLNGWLEQPAVASRSYLPFFNRGTLSVSDFPREPWREYSYGLTATSTPVLVAQSKALVLHASEAGNTFLVTYTISIGGVTRTMTDVPATAESEVTDVSGLVLTDFLGKYRDGNATKNNTLGTLLYLPDANGYKIGLPINEGGSSVTQHITSILSLRGSSVRVRSAWFDGSRYSQAAVTGYRSLDVESSSRP